MSRRITVYGPAYLDRVLRVDGPLVDPDLGPPLDQSVDGQSRFGGGGGLRVCDPSGFEIAAECPSDWPGPMGRIDLDRVLRTGATGRRSVRGISWRDDLGGMGAGFASALGGTLVSALGPEPDPTSLMISDLMKSARIAHRVIRVEGHSADWTLLLTSGGHGDKLAVGFRGCHAAIRPDQIDATLGETCDVLVVAALPNRLASRILKAADARLRFFAPAMRNMLDAECPISGFAGSIDVLCCNRREWEGLDDREEVAWRVSILAITDGPAGSIVRFTGPTGDSGRLVVPAFPRSQPPRDTNRAGESYASTLLATLLDHAWSPEGGVIDADLIGLGTRRASAAAALVLDRVDFGFPSSREIDAAIADGRID
jgi:ribokinase